MRHVAVLLGVFIAFFALVMIEVAYYVQDLSHGILTISTMILTALLSLYVWERRSPEDAPEQIRKDIAWMRERLRDVGEACHFPALWGVVAAFGLAFPSMFLGASRETFFLLMGAGFASAFVVALMLRRIRFPIQLGITSLE